jgi:hypothetical protein
LKPWLIFAALVVGISVYGLFGSNERVTANQSMVAAPSVNDKYIANLNRFAPGSTGAASGVMKIVRVDGAQLEFAVSKRAYNKAGGAERDVAEGRAEPAGYYSDKKLTLSLSEIKAAVADNSIVSIRR